MEENKVELKYTYKEAKELYDSFNLKFRMESVVYLHSKGLCFNDLVVIPPDDKKYEIDYNTIHFVAAGIMEKAKMTPAVASIILDKWMDAGFTLEDMRHLMYEQASANAGFFNTPESAAITFEMMAKTPEESKKATLYTMGKTLKEIQAMSMVLTGDNSLTSNQ